MNASKYTPLFHFLSSSRQDLIKLNFSEIERILGVSLPKSAYNYRAWWSNSGHRHSLAWRDAGYQVQQVNHKDETVFFRKSNDNISEKIPIAISAAQAQPGPIGSTGKSVDLLGYRFYFLQEIIPKSNGKGGITKDYPHERYINQNNLPLFDNGRDPFCRFSIDAGAWAGVYLWMIDADIIYIGETANLIKRFNMGYGLISPRNCFKGGQQTNCKMNRSALELFEQGKTIELYFYQTCDHKRVERELLSKIETPYNARR